MIQETRTLCVPEEKDYLNIREQFIYQWIDGKVANIGDKIAGWERLGAGALLFRMQSEYNLVIASTGGGLTITQDVSTDQLIRKKAKEEGEYPYVLVPDAAHPYKIIVDWEYPDYSSFKVDGQFDLRRELIPSGGPDSDDAGFYEREGQIIPVWEVFDQG